MERSDRPRTLHAVPDHIGPDDCAHYDHPTHDGDDSTAIFDRADDHCAADLDNLTAHLEQLCAAYDNASDYCSTGAALYAARAVHANDGAGVNVNRLAAAELDHVAGEFAHRAADLRAIIGSPAPNDGD